MKLKLFQTNAITGSLALTIPKALHNALGWKKGTYVQVVLGRDRSLVVYEIK